MRADEAVVLAGGLGTRLRNVIGGDVPKPLAPVAGRPFLARVLDQLAAQGLRRVVLATGHMADKVGAAIGTRWSGMDIAYSVEEMPLGIGLTRALLEQGGSILDFHFTQQGATSWRIS